MDKIKILALRDAGMTGIAESIQAPLMHWHEQGHEIWELALGFNGWTSALDENRYKWRERVLRVNANDPTRGRFGQECIASALSLAKPDVVISAFDVWMVSYLGQPELDPIIASNPHYLECLNRDTRSFQHIAYFPLDGLVDGAHLPRGMDETIASFDIPITYSRYAQAAVLRDTGLDIPFIPISHDPAVYHPGDRTAARTKLNLPVDKFIIGMIASNQYRKLWGEFIKASAEIARRHDDVMILPFTTWDMQIAGGADIADFVYREDVVSQTINFEGAPGLFTDESMANLYRSLDVCVLTTVGEGCGLPPLRARASGVPALVSDNTSNTEFVARDFEKIPSFPTHYDNGSNILRFGSDVDVLIEKLETLYQNRKLRDDIGEAGVKEMRQYEHSQVLPMWDRVLQIAAAK